MWINPDLVRLFITLALLYFKKKNINYLIVSGIAPKKKDGRFA
jgi:phage shock protein PspC (stress-responsive transcriptional regulator)